MKLELKHLAIYLAHELRMIFEGKGGRIITLTGITNQGKLGTTITDGYGGMWLDTCRFKPILRPMSDLLLEIEHKGEKFIPIEKLRELYCEDSERDNGGYFFEQLVFKDKEFFIYTDDRFYTSDYHYQTHESIGYELSILIYNKLLEWHFDVNDLIEDGLAIDINTLN